MRTIRHELSLRSLFSVIAVGASLWLLARIWQIILLLVIALVLAGTLSPIVDWLERHRIRRGIGLGLVLVALIGAVVGLGALVLPAIALQVGDLVASAPAIQARLADTVAGIPPLAERAEAIRRAQPGALLAPAGSYALRYATAAASLIISALTTVVLAFYLLADHQRVQGFTFALLPRRYHLRTARILLDMETIVGGYVRGQALTSLLIGIFAFVLLTIMGVPNPLALAVFAAFTDLIPFIGGVLALTPATLAALAIGPVPGLIVFVAFILYQQIESNVLVPRVYGQTLRLSPVAVTVALLIGGQLLGVVGALLALPIAAGLRVLVEDLRIELPGEQTGEETERVRDEAAEATYAERAEGTSAIEAAAIATEMAGQLQEEREAATGQIEIPIEERAAPGHSDPPLSNPAR